MDFRLRRSSRISAIKPSFSFSLILERFLLSRCSFPRQTSIYEPTFSDYSHGFRINKSCHTALKYVQKYFTGTKWFVEGDIKGCFDNVDHHVLIDILRKRIADEHFIGLLWKFLKAGYMEDWNYHHFQMKFFPDKTAYFLFYLFCVLFTADNPYQEIIRIYGGLELSQYLLRHSPRLYHQPHPCKYLYERTAL